MVALAAQLVLVVFVGLLLWAAVSDVCSMIIPNRVVLAIVALYPAWAIVAWPVIDPLMGIATGSAVLAVGFVLFTFNLFGGGDVKLLAAVALWAGPSAIVDVFLATAVLGGAMALASWANLTLKRCAVTIRKNLVNDVISARRQPIPYGAAIAGGGIYLVMQLYPG